MSNDPFYADEPPGSNLADRASVRERVLYPAIFLLVVGALNLVGAFFLAGAGMLFKAMPPEQVERTIQEMRKSDRPIDKLNVDQWDEALRQGYTVKTFLEVGARLFFSWAGIAAALAIFILIGAIRMIQLRSYGLAVFASVLGCLPFLSPSCCLGLGLVAGIWSLVVLLNADVSSTFQ